MRLIDQLGNKLDVDDLVHFNLPSVSVVGKIIEIQPGSTLAIRGRVSGKDELRSSPGRCVVRIDVPITFDPRANQLEGSLKIVDPNPHPEKAPDKPQLIS